MLELRKCAGSHQQEQYGQRPAGGGVQPPMWMGGWHLAPTVALAPPVCHTCAEMVSQHLIWTIAGLQICWNDPTGDYKVLNSQGA